MSIRRAVVSTALVVYCVLLFLGVDFVYSTFLHEEDQWPRYPHPAYHHALVPRFDGYDSWGDVRYPFVTNSLGFRDARMRDVPLAAASRRVLLIGDSFTEGTGVAFEESFAGRLYAAGMQRREPVEVLDAGVISYSPTLYYRKIKYLIERGLRFDEVVVFSDVSDVYDEASKYFCHDDDPQYQTYCDPDERALFASLCDPLDAGNPRSCSDPTGHRYTKSGAGAYLTRHFIVTNAVRVIAKFRIQQWLGNQKKRRLQVDTETAWLFADRGREAEYAPLGSAGGMARSVKNMQALADLLKAHGIPLTIVVYPWPAQLALGDHDSRQVSLWRDFCATNCKAFINLLPAFFAEAQRHADWYERLYIPGDFHYSAEGHRLMFETLAKQLL
jgi:lysophospholipase L1-like esterase